MRLRVLGLFCGVLILGCPPPPANNSNLNGDDTANSNSGGSLPGAVEPIPAPVPADITLLNEVRFNPAEGEPQFVELKAGAGGLPTGLRLANEAAAEFMLPADAPSLQPGQLLLILFDGGNRTDGATVHAAQLEFLNRHSDVLSLQDAGGAVLDRLSWGPDRPGSVRLGGGGLLTASPPGSLIRRAHSTQPDAGQDWALIAAAQATPGTPNPNPTVGQLFPLDGVLRQAGDVLLSWFPLEGATGYRVQVSTSEGFESTIVDEVVERPPATRSLPAGELFWRVQAIFAGESKADFSAANTLTLVPDLAAFEAEAETETAGTSKQRQTEQPIITHLLVPLYAQRKDTKLLLLETDFPTGTRQAWNAPHPDTDEHDPADNTNCALGTISMVNAFLAGTSGEPANLSQDRIGFEVYTKLIYRFDGPEYDFNYGRGLYVPEYLYALNFAIGATAASYYVGDAAAVAQQRRNVYPPAFRDQFWTHLMTSINNNRPVPLGHWTGAYGTYAHAVAATGYYSFRGERYVRFNDPWHGMHDRMKLRRMNIIQYFILPGGERPPADESELRAQTDDDHDRILDWDERNRFHTFADKKDSDKDCIEDFDEIELSVFDERHGWGQHISSLARGLPPSSDGAARRYRLRGAEAPEISNDSDGGGLPDFCEDLNGNGQIERDKGESDPFDPSDDKRKITGTHKWVLDRQDPGFHGVQTREFEYDLHVADGKITGTARAKWSRVNVQMLDADPPECPEPRTRTATSDPVDTTLQIEGEFVCNDEAIGPAIILREREPVFTFGEVVTFVDTCRGTTRSFPGMPFGVFMRPPLDPIPERFMTGPNRHVQHKGRYPWSSLERERDSFVEWDVTMEPQ